jgi:hypothetical protein
MPAGQVLTPFESDAAGLEVVVVFVVLPVAGSVFVSVVVVVVSGLLEIGFPSGPGGPVTEDFLSFTTGAESPPDDAGTHVVPEEV